MWTGDSWFVLSNLVQKDFKIRYRNMSLGMLWSVLNPLVMMSVLTFVWTQLLKGGTIRDYAIGVLCGLVPFNFFSISWITGTNSLVDNSGLIKRVLVPREIVPVAAVLSNCMHLFVQIGLVLALVLAFGRGVNRYWLLLPLVWAFAIVFVCGLAMACAALNVYVRDMRYVVESATTVLFWLVPVVYPFTAIPDRFRPLYEFNPLAAQIMAMRNILVDTRAPAMSLMVNLAGVSVVMFLFGWILFQALKRRFYEYL
jgi:ABC-type polysaccharide/polyol phosphate export permease